MHPVCGNTELQRLTTQQSFLATAPASISYRCAEGHVFVVDDANAATAE